MIRVLLVAALLAGCGESATSPSEESGHTITGPCGAGEGWTQAESIVTAESVDEPITGVVATFGPLDADNHLPSCVATFGVDEEIGFSAANINLAAYDRHERVGGDLIQLGIARRSWDPRIAFVYSTELSMMALAEPYPQAGQSYGLSINLVEDAWHLRIVDEGGVLLHEVVQPATWTSVGSASVMFEAMSPGSVVGAATEADAPSFDDIRVETRSGLVAGGGPCIVRRATRDETGAWTTSADVDTTQCEVIDGMFSAHGS
jgi:hypothetical protein